jgi:hypothetical protein
MAQKHYEARLLKSPTLGLRCGVYYIVAETSIGFLMPKTCRDVTGNQWKTSANVYYDVTIPTLVLAVAFCYDEESARRICDLLNEEGR